MPKIETYYQIDERDLIDTREIKRLVDKIQQRLADLITKELLKGNHITFLPPEVDMRTRAIQYKAEFEFRKPHPYIPLGRSPTRTYLLTIGTDEPDRPLAIALASMPKPPCNCNKYHFCPYLCK